MSEEVDALPAIESPPVAPPGPISHVVTIVFTGHRSEYFRIWVVNLLLTLLTAGVYSAWAKVRKAKYFRNNTRLDGHVFDYHGNPVAILRGRLVALVLLAAYSWAFELSKVAGLMTVATLFAVGPLLFMRAQQFALANTSYRGLRFGFHAHTAEAYRTVLPVLVVWVAPTVILAFVADEGGWIILAWLGMYMLTLPWMHHRLKAYQRRNAAYGDRQFTFVPALRRFYVVYAKGLGFVGLGAILGVAPVMIIAVWQLMRGRSSEILLGGSALQNLLLAGVFALFVYVLAWPYYAARLQQVVWDRTRLGDIRFRTEIRAWPLFRLVLRNVVLTVLTGGLYWPCAVVALARYRIQCMHLESEAPLSSLAAGLHASAVSAAGEGATDAFGLDIGL